MSNLKNGAAAVRCLFRPSRSLVPVRNLLWALMIYLGMAFQANAYDFEDNGCYFTITSLSDLTVALTNSEEKDADRYDYFQPCYSGDFTVPQTATYSGRTFTVTGIDEHAFDNCSFTKLVIPETVLMAGRLRPSKVDYLVIEDGSVPLVPFLCENCIRVYIGRNFGNGYAAFSNSKIESVEFGPMVTYIAGSTFSDCASLKSVVIPSSVKYIYAAAFANCSSLEEISAEGVTDIFSEGFTDCKSLKTINFPQLKLIKEGQTDSGGVFQGCTSLKNVTLPVGCYSIGMSAFSGCTDLETVTLPSTIANIGRYSEFDDYFTHSNVFTQCPSLKTIVVGNKEPLDIAENTFDIMTYLNATLKVPAGSLNAYKEKSPWSNFANIQEDASIVTDDCTLLVRCSEFGSVEFLGKIAKEPFDEYAVLKSGDKVELTFIPDPGYYLDYVEINYDDALDQVKNKKLTIEVDGLTEVFVGFWKIDAGVSGTVEDSTTNIYSEVGKIVVSGASANDTIRIYNTLGVCLLSAKGNGAAQTFDLPASNIYIVKVGESTKKIVL